MHALVISNISDVAMLVFVALNIIEYFTFQCVRMILFSLGMRKKKKKTRMKIIIRGKSVGMHAILSTGRDKCVRADFFRI